MVISIVVSPGFTAYLVEVETFETPVQIPDDGWVYDEETRRWCIEFPAEPLKESFVKKYGILNRRAEVGVIFSHEYLFPQVDDGEYVFESKGYVETSYDRGKTWWVLDEYDDTTLDSVRDAYTTLTSCSIWIRFTVEGTGDTVSTVQGYWCVWDIDIIGDTRGKPPQSIAEIPAASTHWYRNRVTVTIRASDKVGVREIHYLLTRHETVVPGNHETFLVSESGVNKIGYWAIDTLGNEEVPYFFSIAIDLEPPIVQINKPEPGLLLFGNKVPLSLNHTIIIGDFIIEATIFDNVSGIHDVGFYLDGKSIDKTCGEPYTIYCDIRHSGNATVKAIAEDVAHWKSIDSLEILYYNF